MFLYHAIRAGMDMGIVNAGQLAIYEDLPAMSCVTAVEDVVLNRRDGCDREDFSRRPSNTEDQKSGAAKRNNREPVLA